MIFKTEGKQPLVTKADQDKDLSTGAFFTGCQFYFCHSTELKGSQVS